MYNLSGRGINWSEAEGVFSLRAQTWTYYLFTPLNIILLLLKSYVRPKEEVATLNKSIHE